MKQGDIAIAVMGTTGVGKSSFISLFTQRDESPEIGRTLSSCTAAVGIYKCYLDTIGSFYLIDTPGFDDSKKSDTEVLKDIAAWLTQSYGRGILLTGIIYLHPINHVRVGGTERQNLLMFKRLCGERAFSKVALVTTFWDLVEPNTGRRREIELATTDEFWKTMIQNGAKMFRHDDFKISAKRIIDHIISKRTRASPGVVTDLQIEMVDQQKTLDQTAAGSTLQAQLVELAARYEKRLADLRNDINSKNAEIRKELEEDRQRFQLEREKIEIERRKLQADNEDLKKRFEENQEKFQQEQGDRGETIKRWEHELKLMQCQQVADEKKRALEAQVSEEQKRRQHLVSRIKQAQSCEIM